MQAHDPRTKERRQRIAILLSLSVGALTVLAANQSAPRPETPTGAVTAGPARADATSAAEAPAHQGTPEALTIVEPIRVRTGPGRPAVSIPRPSPHVVSRLGAGANAVFLGDSYTSGWNGAGLGARGWPGLVGRARAWHTVNLAVAGTGYMNPGWTGQPVGALVSRAIRQQPDVVFVAAGHNDSRWSVAATSRAADGVIDRLHRALPDAVLVIVAPIWPSGNPPTRCLDLRDHLRRTARSVGAIFVDPLAPGWFAGSRRAMIGPDGIHPTDAGYRYMAKRILEAIAEADYN
jgi:lysophospholipase L1-like esterase